MPRKTKPKKNNNRRRLNPGSNPPSRQGSNVSNASMIELDELAPRTMSEFLLLEDDRDLDRLSPRSRGLEETNFLENYRQIRELERREAAAILARAEHAAEVLAEHAALLASQASEVSPGEVAEVAFNLARNAFSIAGMFLGIVDSVEDSDRIQDATENHLPPSLRRN